MDKIISKFNIEGKVTEIKALGEGFINDTLLVFVEGCEQPKYILQRKNHLVFPDVPAMMENIRKVTAHIKAKVAASKVTSLFDNAETVGDVKIASAYFTGTSGDTLRGMCDTIRDSAKAAAVAVLVGKSDDKITMAVTVTKDAQAKGLKAGNLVKEISAIAGGKGGGKPDFAMAGLKDETKLDEALAAVKGIVEKQLG